MANICLTHIWSNGIILIEVLPIDGWPLNLIVTKVTANVFSGPGGYFCAFLLLSEPIAYPSAKHVIHRLRMDMNKSVVSITQSLLS